MTLAEHYLQDVRQRMQDLKTLGERALRQIHDDEWHSVLAPDGNSAAVLVQHLTGNMKSRWGAFQHGFTGGAEGETPGRNRDLEFQEGTQSAAELFQLWSAGWSVFLTALARLQPDDLSAELTIRGETHTVLQAIQRQVMHYSGHVYQLILLVKTLRGAQFQTLSIPRGGSAAYNRLMAQTPDQ